MASNLVKYAAEIVAAYVSNNEIHAQEVPILLDNVFGVLARLPPDPPMPAAHEIKTHSSAGEAVGVAK